jgi:hypothetical protein
MEHINKISYPLKVAVVYTGQIRTMEHTLPYFIENVLNNNISDKNKANKIVHVFATLEHPSSEEEKTYFESLLVSKMGDHIKSLVWLDRNNNEWIKIRERLLKSMNIHEQTKHYLRTSGSMIEYYQTYLCYQRMKSYEDYVTMETGIEYKYDFVERVRTDIVICDPLDYHWIDMDKETLIKKLDKQVSFMKKNESSDQINTPYKFHNKLVAYFMTSLVNEDRFQIDETQVIEPKKQILDLSSIITQKDQEKLIEKLNNNSDEEPCINLDELQNYILYGDYIIIFRANLVYFTNRSCFEKIYTLGIEYGCHNSQKESQYFWNSESQFQTICSDKDISIFNSDNFIESKSLYEYEKSNYFDENNQLKKRDDLFYFIMRSF